MDIKSRYRLLMFRVSWRRNTALIAVEYLVLTDFAGSGLMLHDGRFIVNIHVGESMRAAFVTK